MMGRAWNETRINELNKKDYRYSFGGNPHANSESVPGEHKLATQNKPAKMIKEGCSMKKRNLTFIKNILTKIKFVGITINTGFIGFNFAGSSPQMNILEGGINDGYIYCLL